MLIQVYVTPNARKAAVAQVREDYFEVRVDERALGGRGEQETSRDSRRTLQNPEIKNHHPKRNENKRQNNPNNPRARTSVTEADADK